MPRKSGRQMLPPYPSQPGQIRQIHEAGKSPGYPAGLPVDIIQKLCFPTMRIRILIFRCILSADTSDRRQVLQPTDLRTSYTVPSHDRCSVLLSFLLHHHLQELRSSHSSHLLLYFLLRFRLRLPDCSGGYRNHRPVSLIHHPVLWNRHTTDWIHPGSDRRHQ